MIEEPEELEETIDNPFIANSFAHYAAKIGLERDDLRETKDLLNYFNVTQAFYAGFTSAINLAGAIEAHPEKQLIRQLIKDELKAFSEANKQLSDNVGAKTVSLKGKV